MPASNARGRPAPAADPTTELADRLHSAAIHLLRRLRREDDASGLGAPQLSALSVIVFGGPITLGALARAEQLRPPTITKLVAALEAKGLVERTADLADRRVAHLSATPRGARLLHEGRKRRVAALRASLASLSKRDRALLAGALPLLERVTGQATPD